MMTSTTLTSVRLGLRANWEQFSLLVIVNAFVGAMVGLERSVLPLIAEADFGLVAKSVTLSFLVSFGVVKALANLFAGRLSDRVGRKRILIAGWLAGLPVPFLIIFAPSWGWVVFANVLLGINQGLCWSTTVIMKIDLVGPKQRGLAMGLNESAGYVAVSLSALMTGYLAAAYGLRPVPFYPGIAFALLGLVLSIFFVRETHAHARHEAKLSQVPSVPTNPLSSSVKQGTKGADLSFAQILLLTSWKDRALFAASQAGLVNNLNDGLVWGLVPIFLAGAGLPLEQVGIIAAIYPAVWGLGQLVTGALSDRWGRKWLIAVGMWVQAIGIALFVIGYAFWAWFAGAVLLGLGTALVYPTLLAAISDVAHPEWRASAVGVYRLWRDGGYAVGALMAGLLADAFGIPIAIAAIGGLTFLSGVIVAGVMYETLPKR
ncbi:MAG: MFS transporter [Anaerolineae bacterium]|nr:MFS transporter [Anaerolineae bacterium]MCQ3978032.1 MFS transporter [Anaerolineae bacterium]GIK38986.1 MAG: MFS transporter [Chloroflexota bacterium]